MSVWSGFIGDLRGMLVAAEQIPPEPLISPSNSQPAPLPDRYELEKGEPAPLSWPAPNFSPSELACKHCGRVKISTDALIRLQNLRDVLGKPLRITSAYRCPVHNANVGGAPLSQHKLGKAFDITTRGYSEADRKLLKDTAADIGFTGFGGYNSFLHVDIGRRRHWGQSWAVPARFRQEEVE